MRIHFVCLCLPLAASSLAAQTMVLDGIGSGASVAVTGRGAPPSSSVELFRNGASLGSTPADGSGGFSFAGVSATAGDSFVAAVGQVWNFNTPGNTEGWNGNGDSSLVASGTWKQTETTNASDMSFTLYGDNLIRTKARALEIRMRFQGTGTHLSSLILRTAGPNGVQNGGQNDDTVSQIRNTIALQHSADFQTFVLDLGSNEAGLATNWLDPYLPVSIALYVPGTNSGDILEIDSIRLTESLRWEFDGSGDLAEWKAGTNTQLANTGGGLLRMDAVAGLAPIAMSRPFRTIGSSHFTRMETRFRQVTTQQPNLFKWAYLSNPSAYGAGGFQVSETPADGNFQTISLDLAGPPLYGNPWGAGGAATLNVYGSNAYEPLFAGSAADYVEVDHIRLHPAVRYGPSQPVMATDPPAYYVSFSGGNDTNSGRSPTAPWKTFANFNGLQLVPGATVRLKSGDVWPASKLVLSGKGQPGNPISLSAYGSGNRPRITGINLTTEPCIVWNNPSHVTIDSMDCRDAKIGIYLRFTGGNTDGTGAMFNNSGVHISHCHFRNMDEEWSDGSGNIQVQSPYELSWGAGIWLGGRMNSPPGGPWPSESTPILDDFSVTHCGFEQVSTGVGMNFYFPRTYRSRFTNFRFEDSWVTGCDNGSMALFYVDGGHARRVDTFLGGSGFYATGTTGGFIQNMRNFTIDDCQFAFNKRKNTAPDGVGFDYEGDTDNVAFTHNVIHDNDGSGMLFLGTDGGNTGFNMSNNTFWNNCRNPKDSSQNNEMRASPFLHSGTYSNNGIYPGAATALGTPAIYNFPEIWSPFTGFATNRTGTAFAAVSARPLSWGFTSSLEGWTNVNEWDSFAASGGAITGTSLGRDPFVESPATWVNTRERRWLLVRMSQTAGTLAQIYYHTETSPTFSEDKSFAFPIIADGVMRDYLVSIGQSANYKGVVTKWRLDPTNAAGSAMAIDRFDSMVQPFLTNALPVTSQFIDVTFNQAMHPDGGVFNPAYYTLSGLGRGTAAANPSTVTLLPGLGEPTYRLTWNTGYTNGLTAFLSLANMQDVRGNTLWTNGPAALATLPQPVVDTDGDGMPDDWETANGLNPGSPADGGTDKDGDGQANAAEYRSATDPSDPSSRLQVKRLEYTAGPGFARVVWASQPGMTYHVEASDSLLPGSWSPLNTLPIVAASAETHWDAALAGDRRFYRVQASRPNPLIPVSP